MNPLAPHNLEDISRFQVTSRREIISILKGFQTQAQLISMMVQNASEVCITSILAIDEDNNRVIIDATHSPEANQRLVNAASIFFSGILDKISIQFSSSQLQSTQFENRPAFILPLPNTLIRLQRREYYRISTPISTPIQCAITMVRDDLLIKENFSLADISCGGLVALDDNHLLDTTIGARYNDCKIDLPSIGWIEVNLEVRNSQELILLNNKSTRRVGFEFKDLPSRTLAAIQRFIMKLERERNAKMTGLG